MPVPVLRQDKAGKNEQWSLDVGADVTTLTSPTGQVLLQWTPADVSRFAVFPSFSRSIKYTCFRTSQGVYEFSMDGPTLKSLRTFANRGIAAAGPRAIRSVFSRAIIWTAVGFVLMCGGISISIITMHELTTGQSETSGPHPVGFISALVGLAVLCRGLYGFRQYAQIKKMARAAA